MTRRQSGTTRRQPQSGRRRARFALDPYFASLVFAGVGLGTLSLATSPRLIILWTVLLGLWLVYREGRTVRLNYRFADISRGAVIGLAVSAPLAVLAFRGLMTAIPILYVSGTRSSSGGAAGTMIFTSLVMLAPLAEELFFRDVLQRERGLWVGLVFYAVAGVILFLPTAGDYPAVLIAVSGATAVLGAVYSFLFDRYGLTVTLSCHVTVNLVLLYVPAVLSYLGLFTQ